MVCRWETYDETEISIEATERLKNENPFFKMIAESSQMKPENNDKNRDNDDVTEKDEEKSLLAPGMNEDEDETIRMISETLQSDVDKMKKRTRPKSKKIRDFNLFEIPRNINLHELILQYVVPRMPDGYGLRMRVKARERRGSVMKYLKGWLLMFL